MPFAQLAGDESMVISKPDLETLVEHGLISRTDGHPPDIDFVSIGLHLDDQFMTYDQYDERPLELPTDLKTVNKTVGSGTNGVYVLPPRGCVLSCSVERISMPLDVMGFVQTKGSIARGFVTAHLCDGQIDPGFSGKITLEIVNFSEFYYNLRPGMPIAQLFLYYLSSKVPVGYNGRYQNAGTPTAMRCLKTTIT